MKRMGRRGMKTAERWKKVLNGKKKRGEKVSGQKKKMKGKMQKMHFNLNF